MEWQSKPGGSWQADVWLVNFRKLWKQFMSNPEIQPMLDRIEAETRK